MKQRSLLDRVTFTRVASWSDCASHRRRLAHYGLAAEKVYMLGYAAAGPTTVQRISRGVQQRSAWYLRGVFRDLPRSEGFWPEPLGPMCAVYLLLDTSKAPQLVVLNAAPESPVLLHVSAKGFPYQCLFSKTLVREVT